MERKSDWDVEGFVGALKFSICFFFAWMGKFDK